MSRIEQPPGKFLRIVFRAPIFLYRCGLGRLMGRRLLLLTHRGRQSGLPRYAVLEVARHDEGSGAFLVPAAFGRKADWYLNLLANPEAAVNHRGRRLEVTAETLSAGVAAEEFTRYAAVHPRAARNLGRLMGISFEDPAGMAEQIPLVALRPR